MQEERKTENKIEQIGNIRLDLTHYCGRDLYCDGVVEDELLGIVQNNEKDQFPRIIEERKSWPILYHLSKFRENIVEWIPMEPGAKVLEVGSGCGAITGALSHKAKQVTCVELSKKRSTINAWRNRDCDNVIIHVGNFADIEPQLETDYDYICLIGVFEYGQSYMQTERPYETFLEILLRHLSPGGRLIMAIENKYGLKYFAGCQEDHLGRYFAGIQQYEKEDGVRTFGKGGLEKIFAACGVKQYSFYYPYPDYKFMTSLYSDRHLPGKGELCRNLCNFDRDRMVLFDEKKAFDGVLEEGLFPVFANSYVAVIGAPLGIDFAKYSNDRTPEYQICTQIGRNEQGQPWVRKYPLMAQAREHVRGMKAAYEALRERYRGGGLEVNECRLHEEGQQMWAEFAYVPGRPLSELMDECLEKGDTEAFWTYFREYVEKIGYQENYPVADFDMVFANIMVQDDRWTVLDYEWTFNKPIPTCELAFRAAYCYLLEDEKRGNLDLKRVQQELGITQDQVDRYIEKEQEFQKFVTGQRRSLWELRDLIGGRLLEPLKWAERFQGPGNVLRLQVYEDRGAGYREEQSYFVEDAYLGETLVETCLSVDGQVQNLRLDPAMDCCAVKVKRLTWNGRAISPGEKRLVVTNGRVLGDSVIFDTRDPNINLRVSRLDRKEQNELQLELEVRLLSGEMAADLAAVKKRI